MTGQDQRALLPEQVLWQRHRQVLLNVPMWQLWRPWWGLSALLDESPDAHPEGLVPNCKVRWATLLDLPRGHFQLRRPREVYVLSARRAVTRHGMPHFPRKVLTAHDFRHFPGSTDRGFRPSRDVLLPEDDPRLFRAATALSLALSAATVCTSLHWRAHKDRFYREVMDTDPPRGVLIQLGDDCVLTDIPEPEKWFPAAYLGFRSPPEKIFELSLRPFKDPRRVYLPPGLLGPFLDEWGGAHEVAHAEMPKRLQPTSLHRRWDLLGQKLGGQLLPTLRAWFEGQTIPGERGQYWLPASIAAPAARRAVPGELSWSFRASKQFFQKNLGGYVFPPIKLRRPTELAGQLPGEVTYDFTPEDPRYIGA